MKHLFELHRIPAVLPGFAGVCALAELAIDHTDIRVIDVAVDVVVREVAIQTLPNFIRPTPGRDNVVRSKQLDAFFK